MTKTKLSLVNQDSRIIKKAYWVEINKVERRLIQPHCLIGPQHLYLKCLGRLELELLHLARPYH